MADRSAAYIFGSIFELLDKEIDDPRKRKRLAKKFWDMSTDYDFSPCQMESDKALMRLGLAKKVPSPDYPDEKTILYYGDDGW